MPSTFESNRSIHSFYRRLGILIKISLLSIMNHNRVKAERKRVVNATRRVKRAEKILSKAKKALNQTKKRLADAKVAKKRASKE